MAPGLSEARIITNVDDRDAYQYFLIKSIPAALVCRRHCGIHCMKRVMGILSTLQLSPMALHAQMQQRQRICSLEKCVDFSKADAVNSHTPRFRERAQSILIATDVAARGLDVKGIEHVIHCQLPRQPDIYLHRSGRTGRANTEGVLHLPRT